MIRGWTRVDRLLAIVVPFVAFTGAYWFQIPHEGPSPAAGWGRPENASCIMCHRSLLEEKVDGKPDLAGFHRLHLESEKSEYQGRQQVCVECHTAWRGQDVPGRQAALPQGVVFHPESASLDPKVGRDCVRRPHAGTVLAANVSFQNRQPYTFKPALEELTCVQCHGPDSKIGIVLFGNGSETWRAAGLK